MPQAADLTPFNHKLMGRGKQKGKLGRLGVDSAMPASYPAARSPDLSPGADCPVV